MSPFKKFFIHFSHYLTGNVLIQLLGLITFPILTRILTMEQYGILGLVSTTMLLAVAVAKAGLSDGIIRLYKQYSETPEPRTVFSSTVMIRGVSLSALTVFLYILMLPTVTHNLKIKDEFFICFMIMAVYLFLHPLNMIVLNLLRANGRTIFMNAINLVGKISSIVLSLSLLIHVVHELYGFFIGVVIAEFVVTAMLFCWFFTSYKIVLSKASWNLTMTLIKFGIPLLFSELSYLLLQYASRYMIVAYHGENALGLYSVGYNLAMYLAGVLNLSLTYAVIPIFVEIYEKEGKEKTEVFLQRCMNYLLIVIIPICVGYYAISKELFITLASHKYESAASFSPIILLGIFLLGMNNILNAGLYLKKKAMTILIIMLSAVLINIVMNLVLLPSHGVMGAAIATLVACAASTILTMYLSFKYIVVRIDIKTVSYYLLLSILMLLVVRQIEISEDWLNLIGKMIAGVFIVASGVLLREREIRLKIRLAYQLKNV